MKKQFLILSLLVVAGMFLTACGGSNTTHDAPEIAPILFSEDYTGGPARIYSVIDGDDWVDINYLGDGEWSCESNYGDGTSVCMSQVGSTINFFWGTEKVGTADSNVPGELQLMQGWEDRAKG